MLRTKGCFNGVTTALHHLPAQAGLEILRAGGNAIEAVIAAASTIDGVHPRINTIGGDGFGLINEPGKNPLAIPCRWFIRPPCHARLLQRAWKTKYTHKGPLAALTVTGAISGWQPPFNQLMVHAGAIIHHLSGIMKETTDPQDDGICACF